jgi:hypothetical protein
LSDDPIRVWDVEYLCVAEETGDVDEPVLGKLVELVCVGSQDREIPIHVVSLNRCHRHSSFDPTLQGSRLVQPEIVDGFRAQKFDYFRQPVPCRVLFVEAVPCECGRHVSVVLGERLGNLRHREHEVHGCRCDRVARHPIIAGVVRILRDDKSAAFLHRLEPKTAVGAGSRKDHADRALLVLRCERVQ